MALKQFEKWWKTQEGKWSLICCPAVAEEAWKAALGWIKYAGVLTDLPKDLIDEELGNDN